MTSYILRALARALMPCAGIVLLGLVQPSSADAPEASPAREKQYFETRAGRIEHHEQGALIKRMPVRRGLAVIADFADARLEDWSGPGIRSEADLANVLRAMEDHWSFLSRGIEQFRWDVVRVTLPVSLSPDAYVGWEAYRQAVAALARQAVDPAAYDANADGIIDSMFVVASNHGNGYDYMAGGSSRSGLANVFVDGQNSQTLVAGVIGNLNHETAHTIGVPDLYGPYGTIVHLSVMADSWPMPPQDFTAFERTLLGWVEPRVLDRPGRRYRVRLSADPDRMHAAMVPTAHPGEYFLIEYRRRPDSGYGSEAPPYDGIAVYHVLESSNQGVDPPLLKLEPADGQIVPDTAPEADDLVSPENASMSTPLAFTSYVDGSAVFQIDLVRRNGPDTIAFQVTLAPMVSPPSLDRMVNPSFEEGSGAIPDGWEAASSAPSTFLWEPAFAYDGLRSMSMMAAATSPAHVFVYQWGVSPLDTSSTYELCGMLRGEDIRPTPTAPIGANVSVLEGRVLSANLFGSFDWRRTCVAFRPQFPTVTVACRLGYYGSDVTGRLWCDNMTLLPLRSAFQ